MELAGHEKRIQALFSEAALRDQSDAPRFEELWLTAAGIKPLRAPAISKLRARSLSKPLLAVATVFVIAAASWGAWVWYRSTGSPHQQLVNVSPETVSPDTVSPPAFQAVQRKNHVATDVSVKFHPNRQNKRRIRQPDHSAITEAALLSRWQSPTQLFLESPATVDLKSLPQLNQSAEELKQFLLPNAELTKESNQ